MYQIIEYNDYRKENYIFLHGVTSDIEKAKQRAQEIIQKKFFLEQNEHNFYQIYELKHSEYVDLQPMGKKDVICQYSYRFINFSNLLGKTVGEIYEMIDEKVPKTMSSDDFITKDIFANILKNHIDFIYLEELLDFFADTFSTIVSVVKCDEF
jgi:hypothetical protein